MELSKTNLKYRTILYYATLILGIVYGLSWLNLFDPAHGQNVFRITQFQEDKPFVFRILATGMARGISDLFSLRPDYAIIIVTTAFFIGSLWAFQYFAAAFSKDTIKNHIFSFGGIFAAFILLMSDTRKVYDPATMFFFALALGLLAREKYRAYYLLFPIATLSRETTFLLTLFFSVYFFTRLSKRQYFLGIFYQGTVYLTIELAMARIFANNGGKSFYLLDFHVYRTYFEASPLWLILSLVLIGIIYFWVLSQFHNRLAFLNVAFLCIFSAQVLFHFLFGYPYEFRVFLESFPIFVLMLVTDPYLSNVISKNSTTLIHD